MSADGIEVVEIAEGISGEIGSHLQRMKEIAEEALTRLQYEKPNSQVCLRTEKALVFLCFEGSELI